MDAHKSDADASSKFPNRTLHEDLEASGQQVKELVKKKRWLKKRPEVAIKQSEEVNKDFVNDKRKSSTVEDKIKKLEKHIDECEEQRNQLLVENSNLKSALVDLEDQVKHLREERKEVLALQEALDELKKERDAMEEETKELRACLARARKDHQNAARQLTRAENAKVAFRKELSELKKEKHLRAEERENQQTEIARLTRVLAEHENIMEDLRRERNEKRTLQEILNWLK